MEYFDEEINTRLKESLDLNELRNPQGKGVEFEVDENELNKHDMEEDTDYHNFDKEELASNICLMSEEEDDSSDNEQYLTEMERLTQKLLKNRDNDLTPRKDKGVLKQLKTPGVGAIIPKGALVKLHYNAYNDIGQPPYDSTRLRGQPYSVRLGKGETILGLELALLSMKKHELSRFLIHHNYAYGVRGCPPRIPAEATLIFDIEVLQVIEQEGVDDYYSLTPEERRAKLTYGDIENVVRAENAEAKEYFGSKKYPKAYGKYKRSMNILENYHLKSADEEQLWKRQLLKVYVNSAICCYNLSDFRRTITYCHQALGIDRNNVKALYFKGKALHSLGSFKESKETLRMAWKLDPTDILISKALQILAKSIKDHELIEKDMYAKMFTTLSSDKQTGSTPSPKILEKKEKDNSEDYGTCSDGFRDLVKQKLVAFQQDSCMTEMPFPKIQMTPAEIACILKAASDLGMDVKQKGTGDSTRYEVYKKTAQI